MNNIQFYSIEKPDIDEYVLVQFTKKEDAFFCAKLLEYNYEGIMNFHDATKKKKIISWNKYVKLNKNMVAKVDNIDDKYNIVQLSLIYLNETKNISMTQIQEKLLIYFNENKLFENFIKSFCIINNYTFDTFWIKYVHIVDKYRRLYNNKYSENLSLWNYFNKIIDNKFIDNIDIEDNIKNKLIDLYNKKNQILSYKISTKFGIISHEGIFILKNILNDILNKFNKNIGQDNIFTIKYDTTPYYVLESNSDYEKYHNNIIEDISNYIKNNELQIYIKI